MRTISEPARELPVWEETDVCVVGGSCTGVFAAVRAARAGARVAIVEKQNCFGGVATAGLVNIWHSLYDQQHQRKIIGGLTEEVLERLRLVQGIHDSEALLRPNDCNAYALNTEELKIELDRLLDEAGVKLHLHTWFSGVIVDRQRIQGVIAENKDGRGVITARVVIDATGDADVCHFLGLPEYTTAEFQPPTYCARIQGTPALAQSEFSLDDALQRHGAEFGLVQDWGWRSLVPGLADTYLHAETHVFGADGSQAAQLTRAETEGRKQVRAVMNVIRKYAPEGSAVGLSVLASVVGVRETRHIRALYRITDEDLLHGKVFEDAIAYGSYRVDIHHSHTPGITFRYLDGTEEVIQGRVKDAVRHHGRWRDETATNPGYYQMPFRALLPESGPDNLLMAGRMLDAEPGAFSALRVMINLNQMGEAAGVAAAMAVMNGGSVRDTDPAQLRQMMAEGGSSDLLAASAVENVYRAE